MKFIYRKDLPEVINDMRWFIYNKELDRLHVLLEDTIDQYLDKTLEYKINIELMFKEIYLYSCLCNYIPSIELLKELYENFDPVQKIALKPVLLYGKYIIKK